jgi:membrane protein
MRRKIKFISPGAALATFLAIVSSVGFSYYVNNFSNYNKVYGSLGAIIITMIWIQINSMALIIGYELNASIAVNRDMKNKGESK